MASSNNANKHQQGAGADSAGNKPAARPHWRHRDPTAPPVYVVHPTKFRDVVQQLTGAPPASPPATAVAERSSHQGGSNGGGTGTGNAAGSNVAAHHQRQGGGGAGGTAQGEGSSSSRQRTLGEMYQECMAWANDDDQYDC